MQLNYRSKEQMEKIYIETKNWLQENLNNPAEKMDAFFEARIDNYENIHMRNWGDVYDVVPDYLPKDINTLLDVGCGSGLELDSIYKEYPKIKVTGIDVCKAMLDKLRQKHNDKDIKLIQEDYFIYPFEKQQYDVVLSVQSLHHYKYEKKKEIYQKIFSATRKGGAYYEFDYMAQDDAYEKLNLDYYERRRKRSNIPDDVFVHIDLPLTVKHQIELMEYAGFKNVEVLNKPFERHNIVFMKAYK